MMTQDDRERLRRIEIMVESMIPVKTTVESMDKRLFGNGQPGIIKNLRDDIDSLKVYRTYAKIAGAVITTTFTGMIAVFMEHVAGKIKP